MKFFIILPAIFLGLNLCHAQENQPPVFSTVSLTTTGWAAGIGFSGNASGNVMDPDGDPLTYSLTGPNWLSMEPDGTYVGTGPHFRRGNEYLYTHGLRPQRCE